MGDGIVLQIEETVGEDTDAILFQRLVMPRADKPIRLSGHAGDQLRFRGGTKQEVLEAIRNAPWQAAELGRLECQQDFAFNSAWNRKRYATKRVRPIFVDEPNGIVVVTMYVYYF